MTIFLAVFEKSVFSPLKIPKKINLLLGKQIFVYTDARFDHKAQIDGRKTHNFDQGGLEESQGGTPYKLKKFNV